MFYNKNIKKYIIIFFMLVSLIPSLLSVFIISINKFTKYQTLQQNHKKIKQITIEPATRVIPFQNHDIPSGGFSYDFSLDGQPDTPSSQFNPYPIRTRQVNMSSVFTSSGTYTKNYS